MRHIAPAVVICAISLAMHAYARADAPVQAATGCGKPATASVAESPQCAERAAADDERPPDLQSPPPRSRWYGWQTLLADGLSLGLTIGGFGTGSGGLGLLGMSGLLIAAPLVHFGHGNAFGALSLGLRVACAALIVIGIGSAISEEDDEQPSHTDSLITVGLVGLGATSFLDAAVLAFRPRGGIVTPYADAHGGFGLRMAWRL